MNAKYIRVNFNVLDFENIFFLGFVVKQMCYYKRNKFINKRNNTWMYFGLKVWPKPFVNFIILKIYKQLLLQYLKENSEFIYFWIEQQIFIALMKSVL